jgi:3-deoxy-D-manno-octulosonic-acid transferase
MRWTVALGIYRLLLPLLFVAAFPGWIVKMLRRGGFGTALGERLAIYGTEAEFEPCGAVHVHAVSVGESLLALKLIREWKAAEPARRFVLATGTATGHAVASGAALDGLRVTYAPLDFRWMVRSYLGRFEPSQVVLIEGEAWPHLLIECRKRSIPVALVNARMSPRSARRYRKAASWIRPLFGMLDAVAVQEAEDIAIWKDLGVAEETIHLTGSLKFDPDGGAMPAKRAEFSDLLEHFGRGRPVVLAASTHAEEEAWIAKAIHDAAPQALPVIVPRHAERRSEVRADLEREGFEVVARSAFHIPVRAEGGSRVFLIDSTGELRDWTAHADGVIIGKSFFAEGGQNPAEAILAGKPLIIGPHMENFQPLASRLTEEKGCLVAHDGDGLREAIRTALDPDQAADLTTRATRVLGAHRGATTRMIALLRGLQAD